MNLGQSALPGLHPHIFFSETWQFSRPNVIDSVDLTSWSW